MFNSVICILYYLTERVSHTTHNRSFQRQVILDKWLVMTNHILFTWTLSHLARRSTQLWTGRAQVSLLCSFEFVIQWWFMITDIDNNTKCNYECYFPLLHCCRVQSLIGHCGHCTLQSINVMILVLIVKINVTTTTCCNKSENNGKIHLEIQIKILYICWTSNVL